MACLLPRFLPLGPASPIVYCANQCRLHLNPGPGLGRTQVTAHKHIPLLLFPDSSLTQSALFRLSAPQVSRLRPRLQAPPIPLGTLPRPRPSTKPRPSPRLLLRPSSGPGLLSSPRPALLVLSQVPPRSWLVAREAYGAPGLELRFRPPGRSAARSQRPNDSGIPLLVPRARPLEAARPARAWRICRDESAGVAPSASRECRTDRGGATGLAG